MFTPFSDEGDNAAIAKNHPRTDKEAIKELGAVLAVL
jgi:hypothetical protein